MSYLSLTLKHFGAIQSWAKAVNAEATLDMRNFELEVRWRHRYYTFVPQFLARIEGRLAHTPALSENSVGFIGWLPYKPLGWKLAMDKLAFKHFLTISAERTPSSWSSMDEVVTDFVLKRSKGSFGYELAGPFLANEAGSRVADMYSLGSRGTAYAEQFIRGENLKVWFWGGSPFYAQRHFYPEVQGDGKSRVDELIEKRLQLVGASINDDNHDGDTLRTAVRYQQLQMDDIPTVGHRIWLDYRYGRRYVNLPVRTTTDNAMPELSDSLRKQILSIGGKLASELKKEFSAPVLFSVDGVIDVNEHIWWLEMNSNPMFPPDGYPLMLETLFGAPSAQIAEIST